MLYGLVAIALLLALPSCGMFRKNSDQGCTDESCQQAAPVEQVEELDVTETVVPDTMPIEGDMGNSETAE